MINKPVAALMYVEKNYIPQNPGTDDTMEAFMTNAQNHALGVYDNKTRRFIDFASGNTTISQYKNGITFYLKHNDKIIKSPGQKPFKKHMLHEANFVACCPGMDQIIELAPCETYCCDKEYGIRFEIKNDELYQQQFKNMYTESYVVPANKCCSDDCVEMSLTRSDLLIALYKEWRANRNHSMLHVYLSDGTAYNPTKVLDDAALAGSTWEKIAFVVDSAAMNNYCQMNFKYLKNRATTMRLTTFGGFDCCASSIKDNASTEWEDSDSITIGSNTYTRYHIAQTSGYDIRQMEFDFMGWMGESPYRLSDVTLSEMGFDYQIPSRDNNKEFSLFILNYEEWSDAPWGHWQWPYELVLVYDCEGEIETSLFEFLEVSDDFKNISDNTTYTFLETINLVTENGGAYSIPQEIQDTFNFKCFQNLFALSSGNETDKETVNTATNYNNVGALTSEAVISEGLSISKDDYNTLSDCGVEILVGIPSCISEHVDYK